MNRSCKSLAVAVILAAVGCGPTAKTDLEVAETSSALQGLTYTLGQQGISSLSYAGQTLVTGESLPAQEVWFQRPDGSMCPKLDPNPVPARSGNTITLTSTWGTMFATYSQQGDTLIIDFGVNNPSQTDTLADCDAVLMAQYMSPTPAAPLGWSFAVDSQFVTPEPTPGMQQAPTSTGAIPLVAFDYGTGFEALAAEPALGPGGTARPAKDSAVWLQCLQNINGPLAGCYVHVKLQMIGPKLTKTRRFLLRFAPSGTNPYDQNVDLFQKYNASKPQQLQWDDRRPLLSDTTLANGVPTNAQNPRRYNLDLGLNGDLAAFRRNLLARADSQIAELSRVGAQGVVIWSIEGVEGPMSQYTGDPTRVELAPEMMYRNPNDPDPILGPLVTADAYMRKFKNAGLSIGNALRPQPVHYVPIEIGTEFIPAVNGTITGLRVFSSYAESNGVHTARIWQTSNNQAPIGGPYTWTYGGENAWIPPMNISGGVLVTAGTKYTVTISTTTSATALAGYPVIPGDDSWGPNAAGNISYRKVSVATGNMGTLPTDPFNMGWGLINALRDVVFVPGNGGPPANLFGSPTVTDSNTTLIHYDVADPGQHLIDMINYCKNRWGSTLFYVDTTVGGDATKPGIPDTCSPPPVAPNTTEFFGTNLLSSDVFKRVQEAVPSVLIMPENQVGNDYAYAAPLDDEKGGVFETPNKVLSQWPGAFSSILSSASLASGSPNAVLEGAKHGDIYFFPLVTDDENYLISVYQQVGHPPTAKITAPANNSTISAGGSITINASATPAGTINHVDLYVSTVENGRTLLKQDTTAPYSFTWSNVPTGRYVFSAHTVNNAGLEMWSSQVVVKSLRVPDPPPSLVAGLRWRYYTGSWTTLPDFSTLTPAASGQTTNFNLNANASRAADHFGYSFSGWISVPADGTYTFYTKSDDASNLFIGNTLVVNNATGLNNIEQSGMINLRSGKHAITVNYMNMSGAAGLQVSYEGPTIPAKPQIPNSAVFRM